MPSRWSGGILPQSSIKVLLMKTKESSLLLKIICLLLSSSEDLVPSLQVSYKLGKNVVLQSWLWSHLKIVGQGRQTSGPCIQQWSCTMTNTLKRQSKDGVMLTLAMSMWLLLLPPFYFEGQKWKIVLLQPMNSKSEK